MPEAPISAVILPLCAVSEEFLYTTASSLYAQVISLHTRVSFLFLLVSINCFSYSVSSVFSVGSSSTSRTLPALMPALIKEGTRETTELNEPVSEAAIDMKSERVPYVMSPFQSLYSAKP